MILKRILRNIVLLLTALSSFNQSVAQDGKRKVTETLVSFTGQSEMMGSSFTFSHNLRRIAYRIRAGKKQIAVVDTFQGKAYDSVTAPVFSIDSRHFAYTAKNGSSNLLIVDHKQNLLLDSVTTITSIVFSTDNKSLSYILYDGKHYYMVFHGVKGKPYDGIDENSITFTADGSRIAYSAVKGEMQTIVYDGIEGPMYKQVGFPILSPDGKRLAYWAIDGNQTFVIADDKKGQPYESVKAILFNSDGKHLAYHATRTGKHLIVYDGKESEMFQFVHTPNFSPDGAHFVYAMELFVEDKEAFFNYAVIDGRRMGPYETVVEGSFRFSDDGVNLSFEVERHDEFFIIYNDKEGIHYSDVMQGTQTFSPDHIHFAYVAEKFDSKRIVNADGVESKSYDDAYAIAYSTDSKRYAYSAKLNDKEFVVADGKEGASYDQIMGLGQVVFDSPDSFHYLALKDKKIYLVEEQF